jgi:hypothetical protein
MTKLNLTTPAALGFVGFVLPSLALAAVSVGDQLGTTEERIRAALTAQGYEITKFEIEAGKIEVEALLDGQMLDLEISPDTGLVIEIEAEDDGDDEDNDDDADDDTSDDS